MEYLAVHDKKILWERSTHDHRTSRGRWENAILREGNGYYEIVDTSNETLQVAVAKFPIANTVVVFENENNVSHNKTT